MDGSYSVNEKTVVLGPSNLPVRSLTNSLNDSAQSIGLEKFAKTVEKNHIKAIRDFTRAQLMFLEEKRKHSSADAQLAERCSEKSKDLMVVYQREKAAITTNLGTGALTQDLLDRHIKETKRIQDKTERLQNRAKLLLQKRKGAAFRSPTSFDSTQKSHDSMRKRRVGAEYLGKSFKDDSSKLDETQEMKTSKTEDLASVCMLQEKAIDTINRGIKQRMQKVSHIPLDNRRRLILRSFYENEHTWLEIMESDAFFVGRVLLGH